MPRLRNSGTQSKLQVTEFDADVSNWGRQVMEDQDYEDDEMSHASLSSGLSPRESRPRTRPWDLAEGYQVHVTSMHRHILRLGNVMLCKAACKHSLLCEAQT